MASGTLTIDRPQQDNCADVLTNWLAAMRAGEFEAAWKQTDRIELPRRTAEQNGTFTRKDHHLVWNGSSFAGQRVLVRCEHGLGDTIQFARYFSRLKSIAGEVVVKAQPMLLDLLIGMDEIDLLLNAWTTDPDPTHDVAVECMELAYAFRDTAYTIPNRVPYLPVDYISRVAGTLKLPRSSALRIGVIWAASDWDTSRSLPFELLGSLTAVSNVQFFSLQQGSEARRAELSHLPIISLSDRTEKISSAAAAMLQMDLIITVDSMTAHLAGALGKPTWMLLQHEADWRWMSDRADSPWYPTMKIYRQPVAGAWGEVVETVAHDLANYAVCGTERAA